MNYQAIIINLLLDKYEKSCHFQGTAQVNRRVALKFNKKDFPLYDIEQVEVKEAIHHAALALQQQGLLTVEWMKFEVGNIISRVFLNLELLPEAYAFVQRKGKEEILAEACHKLAGLKEQTTIPWIQRFCSSMLQEMNERKKFPKYLPRDQATFDLLLATLRGIEQKGEDDLLERIFSRRYLDSSKEFEKKMRSRLVTIVKNFLLEGQDIEEEEILQHIGLIKTSEDLSFFGPLEIKLHGQEIDFSPFCYGAAMNTEMIRNFKVTKLPVSRVTTIENKAAYLEYIKNAEMRQELVVYLAGFYSPVKRLFLEKIYNHVQEHQLPVSFYHWGDLDLGGFQIFIHLKGLIPHLQPLQMDVATLRENSRFGDTFDAKYRKRLEQLLDNDEYTAFSEVIEAMLQMGIKLEQEALVL